MKAHKQVGQYWHDTRSKCCFHGHMSRAGVDVAYTSHSDTDSAVLANCYVCESDSIIMQVDEIAITSQQISINVWLRIEVGIEMSM